jgi:1-aminocyclopropane-1-carboxylate deaminase
MLEKFARYPLTFGPSYIHPLERLSAYLGNVVRLYAKREDCNSGLAFGGNKLRKLEFIVPDAIASGADTLLSIGSVQSNHTRMVAATAAKIGMKCRLVQESWVPHEDAVYDRVGNIMLSRIMGADLLEKRDHLIRESLQPLGVNVHKHVETAGRTLVDSLLHKVNDLLGGADEPIMSTTAAGYNLTNGHRSILQQTGSRCPVSGRHAGRPLLKLRAVQ